jgi:beta-glucosidase
MGMVATFDPELMREFGHIAAKEYRAMGIATALSPQVDLPSEPRWNRFYATMGEDPTLAADMTRAYCDGFQTSFGDDVYGNAKSGWGKASVNAMVKHWPGGGTCEAGRDAHFGFGKYAVYPGNNFEMHKIPFVEGAFKLEGGTKMAAAVMPYYTISYNQTSQNVANSYNKEIITDMLRNEAGYDGVVCTDWAITQKYEDVNIHGGKPWGVEHLTEAERHYLVMMAGCDQFGGNNDKLPVLEAYQMGVKEHGEEWMRNRMEMSARRLLMNIFRVGLFENPYLDLEESEAVVGCPEHMDRGYEAQRKSVIMLKNRNGVLPLKEFGDLKVFVPLQERPASEDFWGTKMEAVTKDPVEDALIEKYFGSRVASADEADIAIVFIDSPEGSFGYDQKDADNGGNGYVPISLQYSDYTATYAREHSIAGGDPFENFVDRSYKGKKARTNNKSDMYAVQQARKVMGDKPVIVVSTLANPFVLSEIEPYADAIFLTFYTQTQIILEFMTGASEPSGLLPFQMPADMKTVEEQFEDVPLDMNCYVDSEGNTYDFAFGLNWSGVIDDERVRKYKR